jgi:PPOX class probable F420-dependent enzyme
VTVARLRRVDIEAALRFIAENHRAVLATRRRDGAPQMSPVAAAVDAQGRVVVSSRETAVKTKNLRRDHRAALCVMNDGFYGAWVQVEALVDYYRQVSGEHPDWDDYRAAMQRERRVLLRITPDRAGPNIAG